MATANLKTMLAKFGSVTVWDVEVYEAKLLEGAWSSVTTLGSSATPLATLDTLKITNINQEGPNKTITGGQNADILLKYGKTCTIEMQDALGQYDVLTSLYGVNEIKSGPNSDVVAISFTDRFAGPKTLVGTTFFIDQATGAKQPVKIVIPLFLADGVFNLTGDAEGDAATFDINGNIIAFNTTAAGEIDTDGKYKVGSDKEFFLILNEAGYTSIKTSDYPSLEAAAG